MEEVRFPFLYPQTSGSVETYRYDDVEVTTGYAHPIKMWTVGVPVEKSAEAQLANVADLPFIFKHLAVMPDVHAGIGATVGSVIPTVGAVIPAAVGVDIGCGMQAVRTTLKADMLPRDLAPLRAAIEADVPHGFSPRMDKGTWETPPPEVNIAWMELEPGYRGILETNPHVSHKCPERQLGTLGGGNHFIEVCLDENSDVWVMLHSGSRGVGNRIGEFFISLAKDDMKSYFINLPDSNLAYLPEGTPHFDQYMHAVKWAQRYAEVNRELMMSQVLKAIKKSKMVPKFETTEDFVDCRHNYVTREQHFKKSILVTRKGAISARKGQLGIIPGSMGARSHIVRGLGCEESFTSASHGAGRLMSRNAAKQLFSKKDHEEATKGVECRKDASVIDETPGAYKSIDLVMEAQRALVEPVHTLKQVLCIKG